jgi:hypothetical protein
MAFHSRSVCLALGAASLLGGLGVLQPAMAQQQGYGQTVGGGQQDRELNFGTGPSKSGSILDSANPIDLMNRIRRGTAMDDATPPGDAIDAALRDYHQQSGSTAATPGSASALVNPAQ